MAPSPTASRGAFMPRAFRSGSTSCQPRVDSRTPSPWPASTCGPAAQSAVHPVRPDMHPVVLAGSRRFHSAISSCQTCLGARPAWAPDDRRREPSCLLPRQPGQDSGHPAGADTLQGRPGYPGLQRAALADIRGTTDECRVTGFPSLERTFGMRTETGPIPVRMSRSG